MNELIPENVTIYIGINEVHVMKKIFLGTLLLLSFSITGAFACDNEVGACRISDLKKETPAENQNHWNIPWIESDNIRNAHNSNTHEIRNAPPAETAKKSDKASFRQFIKSLLKSSE